jgi:hypothetical protein
MTASCISGTAKASAACRQMNGIVRLSWGGVATILVDPVTMSTSIELPHRFDARMSHRNNGEAR